MNEQQLIDQFTRYFSGNTDNIRLFFAPGRVNLIGEHTDYNGGFVFPAALTIGTYMAVRQRNDGILHVRSENFPLAVSFDAKKEIGNKAEDDWANYPKGIVKELQTLGLEMSGADILYYGNIPNGAGLSSSASIGMVTAYGLSRLEGSEISELELALLCQRVENTFIGVNSGIMDQFAVGFGKRNMAVFLNCDNNEFRRIPLNIGSCKLVITNTNKRRGLADSKYNERRSECEQGLAELQQHIPGLRNLGSLSLADFEKTEHVIKDEVIRKRVRHVVTEDDRVLKAVDALEKGDLKLFGDYMKQSHLSLREDYEVTGKELDTLFVLQSQHDGCVGSRMTGAGFGGCTVSIVESERVDHFMTEVGAAYEKQTGLNADFYVCDIGDGVQEKGRVKTI
ncbi:galactokinase [Fictibacillus aquaticus]|uniref:Galactokinase n=1 Tax=Fictibacillus aquaticus TaxID=2021314 RepID=A0A235F9U2_9BACL|nr:galactokinase [Fictibacillus aquaticus]OYD57485.1 galactokinase [Fictibacillus aquaticus]